MKVRWKKLLITLTVWLFLEILLNVMGLDDLADYGEFVFEQNNIVHCG
ncbi:MAG: hypothetical protein SXA11_21735 [Cyanobacteriota bacterium]|nr:hypothetical protein [Cyanobacteriota bacterium]